MSNMSIIRNKQQEDLLQQLEKAEAPLTAGTDSLDTLKANSSLARSLLEMKTITNGFVYQDVAWHPFRGVRRDK